MKQEIMEREENYVDDENNLETVGTMDIKKVRETLEKCLLMLVCTMAAIDMLCVYGCSE